MDMSERQPLFLKDKGDAMHRAGNYKAALNAYSKALRLDASLTACQSNRALTHLKLQDWRHAALIRSKLVYMKATCHKASI